MIFVWGDYTISHQDNLITTQEFSALKVKILQYKESKVLAVPNGFSEYLVFSIYLSILVAYPSHNLYTLAEAPVLGRAARDWCKNPP